MRVLQSDIEEERINASWMLLKIVNCHPTTLFQNLAILNKSLQEINKEVLRNIGKIIEFLGYKDPTKISSSIPSIVNLLDNEDPQIRFTASLIFKAISRKHDKFIAIPKLAKLLDDENSKTQLNAISALIELTDEYVEKILNILYEKIKNKNEQVEVSELIFKISSRYPEKSVKAFILYLLNEDVAIRRFTLIFLNNLAGKYLDSLVIAIPQLVKIMKDKDNKNRVMASNLLLKISQDHGNAFKECIQYLEELFKKAKKILQLNLAAILINVNRFYPDQIKIIPDISKKLEKAIKSSDYRKSEFSRKYLSIVYMWNDDYGPAIKICQDLVKKFPLKENFELQVLIARIYHVIGDFKNAIRYYKEASKSQDPYIRILSLVMLSYDNMLQKLNDDSFTDAFTFLKKAGEQYNKLSEILPAKRKNRIDLLISYIKALSQNDFDIAKEFLNQIMNLDKYAHKWEIRAQMNELKNLNDLCKRWKK
ncbi:MAG: hypothetical protein ACTSO9_06380 [Candidatus Helarchaeota archaeon]